MPTENGVFMLNRMVMGVAAQVKRFAHAMSGLEPQEVDDAETLRGKQPAMLFVGWRHICPDLRVRMGTDVVLEAARVARPDLLVFVVPDHFAPDRYTRERETFGEVIAAVCGVWVLEVAELRSLGVERAVQRARDNVLLAERQPRQVRALLGDSGRRPGGP